MTSIELSTKDGGFSSKDLADKYAAIAQISEHNYKARHASYDLRKFRAKKIVQRKEGSRKYHVTANGIPFDKLLFPNDNQEFLK